MTPEEKIILTTEHCAVCYSCKPSMLVLREIPCWPCCQIDRELVNLRSEE